MTIAAHPSDECLTGCAWGPLPTGLSLVVATHLALRPASRRTVERLEPIGGALLADGQTARVTRWIVQEDCAALPLRRGRPRGRASPAA